MNLLDHIYVDQGDQAVLQIDFTCNAAPLWEKIFVEIVCVPKMYKLAPWFSEVVLFYMQLILGIYIKSRLYLSFMDVCVMTKARHMSLIAVGTIP